MSRTRGALKAAYLLSLASLFACGFFFGWPAVVSGIAGMLYMLIGHLYDEARGR